MILLTACSAASPLHTEPVIPFMGIVVPTPFKLGNQSPVDYISHPNIKLQFRGMVITA